MATTPHPGPVPLADRTAALLLGVDVDADATEIRRRFRRLVRAVHPDCSTGEACTDLGRLADAKDRLLSRAAARDAEFASAAARLVAAQARREEALAARRDEARRRVEAMRAVVADGSIDLTDDGGAVVTPLPWEVRPVADRLGQVVDLAG